MLAYKERVINEQSRREQERYCQCGHHVFEHRVPFLYLSAMPELADDVFKTCLKIGCDCLGWKGPSSEEWQVYQRLRG